MTNYSIFVGNLSYKTNERELRSFFESKLVDPKYLTIVYDKNTNQSRGFAFVQFDNVEFYEIALKLDGNSLAGRTLKISPNQNEKILSATTSDQKTRVVHCKKSNYDIYIGRPSIWGNPFVKGRDGEKADRINKYRAWILTQPELMARAKIELRGRILACWCKPEPCHGDILAEIADTD